MTDVRKDTAIELPDKVYEDYLKRIRLARRSGSVHQEDFIKLVNDAIGIRSMSRFADEIGVNTSSISRILNGKVLEVSSELLAKIAAYASPESGVTLEKLMMAQGLSTPVLRQAELKMREQDCIQIVIENLCGHGFSATRLQKSLEGDGAFLRADQFISTNAISKGFGLWSLLLEQHIHSKEVVPDLHNWLRSCMAWYYCGRTQIGRFTMMYIDGEKYERAKSRITDYIIPDEISIILISPEERRVIEEYIIPLRDGSTPKFVFNK